MTRRRRFVLILYNAIVKLIPFVIGILIVTAIVFWYAQYENVPNLTDVRNFEELRKASPTVCEYSTSDFSGSARGKAYFLDGSIRFDFVQTAGQNQETVHVIIDGSSYKKYIWTDSGTVNLKVDFAAVDYKPLPDGSESRCAFWKSPDTSLFIAP